jgi:hypothetical protein
MCASPAPTRAPWRFEEIMTDETGYLYPVFSVGCEIVVFSTNIDGF